METTSAIFLILTNAPLAVWRHQVETCPKVIGRGRKADIAIPSALSSVSRRHAEVWSDGIACWIRDLGSKAGTRLNGVGIGSIPKAQIVPGDLLLLGAAEIQIVKESSFSADAWDNDDPHDSDGATKAGLNDALQIGTQSDSAPPAHQAPITHHQALSRAEIELLVWVARGLLGDAELGSRLHRSPNTVRTQIGSILRKLGLHSRGELIGWIRRGATDRHS